VALVLGHWLGSCNFSSLLVRLMKQLSLSCRGFWKAGWGGTKSTCICSNSLYNKYSLVFQYSILPIRSGYRSWGSSVISQRLSIGTLAKSTKRSANCVVSDDHVHRLRIHSENRSMKESLRRVMRRFIKIDVQG
jgi:hypothetical protein